jgi:DNA polymerase III subunit delta'
VMSGRLSPLNLFVGPEGVGKKKVAMALAQVLVCETSDRACGECGPCQRIANDQSESLLVIRPDGQQIKVEQSHQIAEFCTLQSSAKARIVIIDQAERLNPQASNSLLKLFEEPPPRTYFFLIAPSPQSVLTTVRSRAQIVRFGILHKSDLQKKVQAEDWILESSGGRLDRVEALQSEDVLEVRAKAAELLVSARDRKFDEVLEVLKSHVDSRETAFWVVKFWREFVRDLWVARVDSSRLIHPDVHPQLQAHFANYQVADLAYLSESLQRLESFLQSNFDTQLNMEVFLRELA